LAGWIPYRTVKVPALMTRPRMSRKSFSILAAPTSVPSFISLQLAAGSCLTNQKVNVFAPTAARTPPLESMAANGAASSAGTASVCLAAERSVD